MSINNKHIPKVSAINQLIANSPPHMSPPPRFGNYDRDMEYQLHIILERIATLEDENEIMKEAIEELADVR